MLCALSRFIRIQSSTVGPVWLHLALCTKLRLNHSISCLRERLFKVWISSPASAYRVHKRNRNLPTFSTKMRYTKGPQIKQANRPTGLVRRRWRGRRRRRWAREGLSYVFLLRGVNRCRIESGIVILLLYDTLFLSSSWLFMAVTKFSLPIRLYCIGV